MNSEPKVLKYRISLPSEEVETTVIGKAEIRWDKCLVFTDGTKKFIKYFKPKKDNKGNRVALRQTYTTYFHEGGTRAFRTCVKTNPRTKEVLEFVRGAEDCRSMITDFNLLGTEVSEPVAASNESTNTKWKTIAHIGV
jgi:hypothetical protein